MSMNLHQQREAVPGSMSCTTTFAPSNANNLAASAPMPCPEPVMMATWPESMPFGNKCPAI